MLAYLDTVTSGLVPVRILAIDVVNGADVVVTGERYAYKRGTIVRNVGLSGVVPRSAVYRPRGEYFPRIRPYSWAKILFEGDRYANMPQWRRR